MPTLVTFGETMLRLAPPEGVRLSRADSLAVHVGGAESNVAVAAANLGCDATWLSKLPDSPLAERVERALRAEGVDPVVARADEGRVGTYYLEPGYEPRPANVVYDRDGAAVRTATPTELALDRVRAADAFYVSGITPALSPTLAETTRELLAAARDADTLTALDVNYRAKLWSPADARETLSDLFPALDVLVVAARDAATVLERDGDPAAVAADLAAEYDLETAVVTLSDDGALAHHDGETHEQSVFAAETLDPVGTGDAFVGAFLARRLQGGTVPEGLAYGAAAAALKRTVAGDAAALTPAEVEAVIAEDGDRISR